MRCPRIPNNQITRFGTYFLPFEAMVGEPFHPVVGEAEPFGCPGGDAWFVGHFAMELFRQDMTAFADYEPAVVGAAGIQVYEALEAAETGFGRVLVLVWPGLVLGQIFATTQPPVSPWPLKDTWAPG